MKPVRWRRSWLAGCLLAWAVAASACDVNVGNGDFNFGLLSGQATDTWSRTYTVAAGGQVEVVNVNGLVQVEPGTAQTVEIRAERRAKASTDEAAKALLGKVEMREDSKPDALRVEAKVPKSSGFGGGVEIKFFVKLPSNVHVVARTTNGGIKLLRLPNDVEATSVNGGVEGDDLGGTVRASTTNGGVRLSLNAVASGGVRAETVNGGVSVTIPREAKANVSARVVNGGLGVENLSLESIGEQSRRRVEGKLNGGGPSVELEATNGGVHLTGK
jgi:hypothetical protein